MSDSETLPKDEEWLQVNKTSITEILRVIPLFPVTGAILVYFLVLILTSFVNLSKQDSLKILHWNVLMKIKVSSLDKKLFWLH